MKVSTRLMLALCAVIWVFMGALLTLRHWQSQNIQSVLLDRSEAISRLSEKTVEFLGKPLQAQCQDYTTWTEMVDFAKTGNPQWAEGNLVPSFKTYEVDAVWVFRPDESLVYFGTNNADKSIGDALPLKGRSDKLFVQNPIAHFFFHTAAGLMEVCGASIHPSEDTDRKMPSAGYFFAGRLWGRAHLDKLTSLLDGSASLMQDERLAAVQHGTILEGGAMVFRHPLKAWDGTPLAILEVRTFSPIIEHFISYLDWEPAIVGIFCLTLLAVLSALLARWVAIPLRMLSAALVNGDPATLVGLEGSNSEYGNIARLVTRHFSQSRALVREMSERIRFEEAQAFLIRCGSTPGEGDFFQSLAKYLAGSLGMDFICIDRLLPDGLTAQTIAVYCDDKFDDNVSYALTDTPCGDVVGKTICCFPKEVCQLFPNDGVLRDLKAESYAGTTLWSSDGRPIGLIAVIGRKPMTDTKRIEAILQLVAVRAAGELERREAESELRQSEYFSREIQKIARLGGWKANPHTDELEWNDGVYEIIEERRDYAPGLTEGMKYYLPEYWPVLKQAMANCLVTREPFTVECELTTVSGKRLWAEVRGLAPIREGERSYVVGTLQDITDRKHAEEAWKASQARYRSLFSAAKDGILILDAVSGRIVEANPAVLAMLGCSAEDLTGMELWETGVFRDIASSRWAFEQLVGGDHIHYDEVSLIRKDGTEIPAEFVGAVYRVGENSVVQCNIRDISERKRLEDQLRQAQKMDAMGQFAGGVAHDFNNLLQVILGNVGLVQRMQPPGAPTWDEVEEVRKAAERAAELTQQLLAFSRRQTIQPVNLDLNQLIQGVLNMLRRLIGERVELCFIPGDTLGRVRVDRGQIEQALMNMSVNARDAMPRGGKLTIKTENTVLDAEFCLDNPWAAEGRYTLITVTDTGRGMDAETRTRIFEPFYTTKEVGQGTGLGLATVYGIVKQHNGLIHVDSVPNKGTIFSVYLPSVEAPVEELFEPEKQPVWGGDETILVAEDEAAVLNLIASLLSTVGYKVLTACDGNEAVRVFEEHNGAIDLAVLDVVMPGLSGREAMTRMKETKPDMLFLFSSGYSPSSIHKDFIVEEGLHLLRKPYRREDLLLLVRQILDARNAPAPTANDDTSPTAN